MKTALLAQNDNTVIENLKQNVGRSVFDLSHSTAFPIDVDGAILPICCIETVPSDSFEISVECMLRQLSPLKVPLFTNLRLNTAFYYCDNRLAWKKWDRFMTGGRSGNEVYEIPTMYNLKITKNDVTKYSVVDQSQSGNDFVINYNNSLHTYFNYSLNSKNLTTTTFEDFKDNKKELPVAFPYFDYQIICRDDYTDIDRLPQNPSSSSSEFNYNYNNINSDWAYSNLFPVDEDEIKLIDGPQMKSGFNTGDDLENSENIKGFILDKVRYHNVRDDYFVSSKKAPMRGDAPTVGLATATNSLDFTNAIATEDSSHTSDKLSASLLGTNYWTDVDEEFDSDNNPTYRINKIGIGTTSGGDYTAGNGATALLKALNKGVANVNINAEITAAELRLLSQLTVWQELNMLHKPYYNDFLNAHFDGVRVGESPVERPQYIGGTSQLIQINQIVQQSASTESSPLGTQGAIAQSLENNYVGKFYCNNYGYIIGIAYIQVDMMYKPAIPRHFSRRAKEDYYSPEFANLSMQAILNKEMFYSNDDDWNNTPWGYTGAFDEMRTQPNHISGDLLNSSYTDLQAWALTRNYSNDNLPSMSSEWLSLKGNVDKTAWQVPTMPAFMLQCANYIKAVRPMPYLAIPKAL